MSVSRRFFLGGALAVAAAAVTKPALAFVSAHPTLYGDGVHDDARALNALLRNEPVWCEGELITNKLGQPVFLRGGIYKVGAPVLVARDNTMIAEVTLLASDDFKGEYILTVPHSRRHVTVTGCVIHGNKCTTGLYLPLFDRGHA